MCDNMEEKKEMKPFKTHVLLPIIFVFSLVVAILFIADKTFIKDIDGFVVWLYFVIVLFYIGVSIFDLIINKNRSKKMVGFIIAFIVLSAIAITLYLVFYLIAKGR